jgi:hypothetical protein
MKTLLVLTTGQTDVQLVEGDARREVDRVLQIQIEQRRDEWTLVKAPVAKQKGAGALPRCGPITLCTPKLDAVMAYLEEKCITLTAALILETQRDASIDGSRLAGPALEQRLSERLGRDAIRRVAFLHNRERYEDRNNPQDAVLRREVVKRIDQAVSKCLASTAYDRIILATTGGFPAVNSLVEEVVRLHAFLKAQETQQHTAIDPLEVSDGVLADPPTRDQAVSRASIPEPAASYEARRRALELITRGNLLGAWGAVQHLHTDAVQHEWTRVVEWLAMFAASLPMPDECDIELLKDPRMAVRAGLRVELALRAGDIPRAVHGTVAFFECAFWDWLKRYDFAAEGITRIDEIGKSYCLPEKPTADQKERFREKKPRDGSWRINDFETGINAWLPKLAKPKLCALSEALSQDIRQLRHDVVHNEPTEALMADAERQMVAAGLWSTKKTFLDQPLVRDALKELGVSKPSSLHESLIKAVGLRLSPRD